MQRRFGVGLGCACVLLLGLSGCIGPELRGLFREVYDPENWRTLAERTEYAETQRYDETVAFCQGLAKVWPQAHYTEFGTSGEGRPLPLLILSSEKAFTPEAARQSDKPLVLLQNCIHPGECAGKDACLALARDICLPLVETPGRAPKHAALLDHVNILIMPIFSPDGHERFSPYSRINQDGPKEMGWRVTATNLNLNRDYMKADAVEMQAWLRVWTTWEPDLLVDNHTTNGSDHQYDLMYAGGTGAGVAPEIDRWMREELYPPVITGVEADGYLMFPYGWPRDRKDIRKGVNVSGSWGPRYSTGYGAISNRPAILLEAHALKPYERRVKSTYAFMIHMLQMLNENPGELRRLCRRLDRQAASRGGAGATVNIPLSVKNTDDGRPVTYKGVEIELEESPITGNTVIRYTDRPVDIPTTLYDGTQLDTSVAAPAAYLVPPQWTEIIDRLDWHGVGYYRLAEATPLDVEVYRFDAVEFPRRPYESRFSPRYETRRAVERQAFVAGTVVVPTNQRRAQVATHLLEPDAPDSLVRWGLMNAIFEQKEYAETYAMEPRAQKMLANDAALRAEFEQRLAENESFATNPGARLNFFYRRSPYWDDAKDRYPITRLTDADALKSLHATKK